MSNVLSEAKKQQVIALGRLGWPLRRIEQETGVRRETAGAYLKAAGIGVRPPGAWGRRPPAKPANENQVTTGSDAAKPTPTINPNPNTENLSNKEKAKPANANAVTTGFGVESTGLEVVNPKRIRSASACEPFREAIELGLSRGRDATAIWQDLVAENGFDGGYQTVKRYVRKLRGKQPLQPRAVILTGPGEESQVDYGTGAMVRDPQTTSSPLTALLDGSKLPPWQTQTPRSPNSRPTQMVSRFLRSIRRTSNGCVSMSALTAGWGPMVANGCKV